MSKNTSTVTRIDQDDGAGVAPAAPPATAPAPIGSMVGEELSGARQVITIHPTDGEGGSDAVFVSHNGYAFQIPRGTPQSVPVEVLEILRNAKTTLLSSTPGGAVVERTVQRYTFTLE